MRNRLRRSRHRLLALLGTAALAMAGAIALPGTAQAANVLTNPGFESGSLSLVLLGEPRLGRLLARARRFQVPCRCGEFE